jgi:TolB-like protein
LNSTRTAVFLSYASQDAAAADKICRELRAAGIEVWFDQSELRGGDAWDATIRKQIKACALFIPIVSKNTHARDEGYFRLEWKLAVDRSHLMTANKTFLLPVVIDDTSEDDDHVPDRFLEVQWSRLPGGQTPPAFVERVSRLLAPGDPNLPLDEKTSTTRTAAPVFHPQTTPRSNRKALWIAAGVLLVILAAFVVNRILSSKRPVLAEQSSVAQPVAVQAQNAIPEKSIAVLPFVDMSEKKDEEYFSDGLSEELLDLLAQIQDLRVAARTSSFYFKGKSDDIATIAQKLRVANILEGSVRKSGAKIRVTAQLIRADNGYHLWSKTYDQQITDIFKVQDQIAYAVVAALKLRLLPAQQIASRHRTDNTEAYTEYLLGNQNRALDTEASNQQALASYRKALALDPSYSAAYSGVADAEWRIADMRSGDPAAYQRAVAAAEKAISLAPDSPEGYWARGQLRDSYYYDWTGAEADYQKSLTLDPNFVPAQIQYAMLLATLHRPQEALAMLRKALSLDPLSVTAWRRLSWILLHGGQFAEARAAALRVTQVNPAADDRGVQGLADLLEGRPVQALQEFQQGKGRTHLLNEAMAEHTLGHTAASLRALDQIMREAGLAFSYQYAEVYAWRGENDKAFEWLETAYRQHDGGLGYVDYDRFLANIRSDPRYDVFLRKLKLAP